MFNTGNDHYRLIYLVIEMKNCFLLCVRGLVIDYIICGRVNVTLDIILGIEDILISWFVIILALLDVDLLFVCSVQFRSVRVFV